MNENKVEPRYPGWPDFINFIRDNGLSGTTEEGCKLFCEM